MVFNPINGKYEYDPWKSFCFNTSNLIPMGVKFWEEGDDWEQINWYMTLTKCNNNTSSVTCKPIEEIDEYIKNMIITREVMQPMIDLDYMDHHLYDESPFENGPYK